MYVVTVALHVKLENLDEFRHEILSNAQRTLREEPGCRQFDVMFAENDPTYVFLYEIYDSKDAFQSHLTTDHFKKFDVLSTPWVREKNSSDILQLVRQEIFDTY